VYLGDKTLLFSDDGAAFIMYAASGRTWAAPGGAVGPAAERLELAWQFRELAGREGYRWLDLGLGPAVESPGVAYALVMGQLGALPYRYAEHFADMTGLARFLDALHPQRQTRCLAVPPGFTLPRVLRDMARIIATPAVSARC
jgi:lysylphosphatidylglycerol synthetase-like protein (DUF2156 family)